MFSILDSVNLSTRMTDLLQLPETEANRRVDVSVCDRTRREPIAYPLGNAG